jgi:anion-transporting  ArsA/GET3 family ATPase
MVRNQTQWMLDILTDPAQTGVVIVSAPEEMPVTETLELTERLGPRPTSTWPPWS